MITNFKILVVSDYVDGACLTLDNAKKHIRTSELLKNEKSMVLQFRINTWCGRIH